MSGQIMSSTKGASEKTNSQSTTVTAVEEAPPARMKDTMLLFKVLKILLLAFCLIMLVVIIAILAIQLVQAKKHKENLNLNYSALESEYSKLNLRYMEAYRKYSVLDQQCNGTNTGKPEDWTCAFCPETWLYFKGKCYYMSNETMTWTSSRDHCISLGGHLVIITSVAKKKFLQNTFNAKMNGPKQSYWIGLSDQNKEGNWLWIDNIPSPSVSNNTEDKDCALIALHQNPPAWSAENCTNLHKFICQTVAGILSPRSKNLLK